MSQVRNSEASRFLVFISMETSQLVTFFGGWVWQHCDLCGFPWEEAVMYNIFFEKLSLHSSASSSGRLGFGAALFGKSCWKFCLHLCPESVLVLESLTCLLVLERLTLK